MTRFKPGDKVKITNDIYYDYGKYLNCKGIVDCAGAIRKYVRTYNIKMSDGYVLRVFEADLRQI